MTSLSIITPAYNEEEIIIASVKQTFESCKHLFDEIEYIVVNDGSSDNTQNLIEENFKNNPLFKLVRKTNGGFGSAISEGISHCTKEYIICVPADSPLDSEVLKRIYPAIEQQKEDLIITYRRKRKGYSLFMLFNSFLYHKVVSILFFICLKDYNWIHIYRKNIFNKIEIQSKGIFMLAELIIKARNNGFSIKEIEVEQKQRVTGIATMTRPNAILKTFKEMLRFRLNIKNE
jgi:glycosyltransferase involved in cell wall biosynthesis